MAKNWKRIARRMTEAWVVADIGRHREGALTHAEIDVMRKYGITGESSADNKAVKRLLIRTDDRIRAEMKEAVDTLRGSPPQTVDELSARLAAALLTAAEACHMTLLTGDSGQAEVDKAKRELDLCRLALPDICGPLHGEAAGRIKRAHFDAVNSVDRMELAIWEARRAKERAHEKRNADS